MKIVLAISTVLFSISSLFAQEYATKDDIKMLIHQMDKRFELI